MGIHPYIKSRYDNLFLNICNSNFDIIASLFSCLIYNKNTLICFLWRRKFMLNFDDSAQGVSGLHSSFEQHPFCCITMAKTTLLK